MIINPAPRPSASWTKLTGSIVACAYNLNTCGPNRSQKPGEECWTVRLAPTRKATSATPVVGYFPSILLRDCTFIIDPGKMKRVKERGTKEVFAFVVGTAMPLNARGLPSGWHAVGFSPLKPPLGRGETQFHVVDPNDRDERTPVDELSWFFGEGRKALGSPTRRRNPGVLVTVDDLRETLADVPDLTS